MRTKLTILTLLCTFGTLIACTPSEPAAPSSVRLFAAGDAGSQHYRIPALAVTAKGTILAFADRRHNSIADLPNPIDIVLRRSTDGGRTWSDQIIVAEHVDDYGYGDAAVVVDPATGDILCLAAAGCGMWATTAENPIDICLMRSRDDGLTWSAPERLTPQLYGPECPHEATRHIAGLFAASGSATCLADGTLAFVVAARHSDEAWPPLYNYLCTSTDGGHTWQLHPATPGRCGDEAKVIERRDGALLMSIRNCRQGYRQYSLSYNRGASWSEATLWHDLPEPACNGDLIRYTPPRKAWNEGRSRLLHSLPCDTARRRNVSIAISYDEGATWPVRRTVWPEESAYSALAVLPGGDIAMLTEVWEEDHYNLWFTRLSLAWLEAAEQPAERATEQGAE